MAIGKLVESDFFFGMWSCDYSKIPKGEAKLTHTLQKGNIIFCRKFRKLTQNSGCIHLVDKASPTFSKNNNGINNTILTQ